MAHEERGWLETVALLLLLVGGFFYVVGWFAGVVLLWLSRVWTRRDKVIGTLVVPGGLLLPVLLLLGRVAPGGTSGACLVSNVRQACASGGGRPLVEQVLLGLAVAALVAAPLAAATHLARASLAHPGPGAGEPVGELDAGPPA